MSSRGGRGRGGKFSKPKRGGGKHFSRDLQPLNAEGEVDNMWAPRTKKVDEDSEEDSSEEEDDEDDSDEDEDSDDEPKEQQAMTREERKAAARKRKDAAIAKAKGRPEPGDLPPTSDSEDESDGEGGLPANPNHSAAAKKQASGKVAEGKKPEARKPEAELSRREREALEAQKKRERYVKSLEEGTTENARSDMERLKLVRERREAEAARKQAEAEEKAALEKEKAEFLAREERRRVAALGRGGRGGKKKK